MLVYFIKLHHNARYKKHKVQLISLFKKVPNFKPSRGYVAFGDFFSEQHNERLKNLTLGFKLTYLFVIQYCDSTERGLHEIIMAAVPCVYL